MISEMIRLTLKEAIGKTISFRKLNNFYLEGVILACDDEFLKYDDRINGVSIISLSDIREVEGLSFK